VGAHQVGEVGHVLVRLLQEVGQALVFLLVDEFTVAFFIFSLGEGSHGRTHPLYSGKRRDRKKTTTKRGLLLRGRETHHQPPHPLLFDALVLFLLLALSVGVVVGDGFGGLLELRDDGAVVLLEVLGVLQDAVEVFLATEGTQTNNTAVLLFYK